ncbi:MAG: DUF1697 domain-containing protein [Planctomycetes bacterium]|nr:DUF1697 domain-containing protein [Planctomycetota bacterium]
MATARGTGGGEWQIALLRGINVGGNKKVPMAELRQLCAGLGWQDVTTYIQSGNVLFHAVGEGRRLEAALEAAIATHFGFAVPVIVCGAAEWLDHAASDAFAPAQQQRPNLLHLALVKGGIPAARRRTAAAMLAPYCKAGEQVELRGDAIWLDFANGVARSKLTPAVLDRVFGATVTARNFKTVQAIAELVRAAQGS